jgi:hypothetical protein
LAAGFRFGIRQHRLSKRGLLSARSFRAKKALTLNVKCDTLEELHMTMRVALSAQAEI